MYFRPVMIELRVKRSEFSKGIGLKVGEQYSIVLVHELRRVRLVGMFFDLNKCFLLPSAMRGIRGIKRRYDEHPSCNLLVVGHTDTSGRDEYNRALSLERAQAVQAYLTDQADAWTRYFGDDVSDGKRWGSREIQLMLSVLPDGKPAFYQGVGDGTDDGTYRDAIRAFQTWKNLTVDGSAGPVTREALVEAYMALDGTTLPTGTSLTVHGCGESFPVEQTGDSVRNPENRRVEVFFFDGPITPPPPGPTSDAGSTAYLEWLSHVTDTDDFTYDDSVQPEAELRICLLDARRSPLVHKAYTLTVLGRDYEKITDEHGLLVESIPADAVAGTLVVGEVTMALVFEELQPIDTPNGAQNRLSNLGLMDVDQVDGQDDQNFHDLLAAYQESTSLPTSGELDAATQGGLEPSVMV